MNNTDKFLDVDFLNTQAIPGESLTQEPGLRPYEKPPKITRPDEALAFVLRSTGEDNVKEKILDIIDAGMSVETICSGLLLNCFSEGIFTPDVAELIKVPLIQYITEKAHDAGISDINISNAPVEFSKDSTDKFEMMKLLNPQKFNNLLVGVEEEEEEEEQDDMLIEQDNLDNSMSEGFIERRSEV